MMSNKLDCAIVRDLLPSFADGLTNEITNREVTAHVKQCPECDEVLQRMLESEPEGISAVPEVDYLKKVRRRGRKTALTWGLIMLFVGMVLIASRVFAIGSPMNPEDAALLFASVNGNTVYVGGETPGGCGLAGLTFEENDGVVSVSARVAPKAFFNQNYFNKTFEPKGVVYQVRMGDMVLWEDGQSISTLAAKLFGAENPYVGDVPADLRVAELLRVSECLGEYTNVLQTDTLPYGWTLTLKTPITPEGEAAARELMRANACMMMATIENLHWVQWDYECGGTQTYRLTQMDEAKALDGVLPLTGCVESATQMQMLLNYFPALWAGSAMDRMTVNLNVCNWSETPIYGMSIQYMLPDGTYSYGPFVQCADGEAFQNGEIITFALGPEDMPTEQDLSRFHFELLFYDQDGKKLRSSVGYVLPVNYGFDYNFYLTGEVWDRFLLKRA